MYAEYRLMNMRAYLQTILIRSIGLPLLYLSSMGLGLGSLVDSGAGGVDGVSYLVFVGPGLLVSSIVMEATGEFTFPVMSGFKWQKHYYAAAAAPLTPAQIAALNPSPGSDIIAIARSRTNSASVINASNIT